ncbi:MAG: AsmA family protein [Steroidobacteraceae bacterium]
MRPLKILGFVLGGLLALVALLLFAVRLFVNPNDFKGRIAQTVRSSTGRELLLPGDLKLAVFPWVALELGPASLGNPAGFSSEPFAAVRHAAVRVKLLPLLRRQLQIGRVEFDGLDVRLYKNAHGKGNWEGFGGQGATPGSPAPAAGAALPDLAGLVIRDSRLSYQGMVFDHVNLVVGHLGAGLAVPIDLTLTLTTSPGAAPMPFAGKVVVAPDIAEKHYRLAPVELTGAWAPGAGAAAQPWKFSVPDLGIDLAAQTLNAPAFAAEFAGAHLTGSLKGSKIIDAPVMAGAFRLDAVAPRDLMNRLGMKPPATRDPRALTKLAASGEFAYGGNAVRAARLEAQLDDSTLRGDAGLTNIDTRAMSFDLALDRINFDRYSSPAPAAQPAPKAPGKPAAVPAASLKSLLMHGTLAVGGATIAGVNLSQVHVGVDARDGVTHIVPAKAQLYGGAYSGDITLDSRGPTPLMTLNQTMTGIDVAPLLMDFAKTRRLSGRGNLTTSLTAHGHDSDALMKSLSGHVAANLSNGALEGIDLWFEITRAISLLQKQPLPAGSSSGHTKFDTFRASADLRDGVASTRDLNIVSQNLHLTGQGTSNLATGAVDYQVKATLLNAASGANARTLADIPVTLGGTISRPTVRPDLGGMAKARVQQELDKHKDELRQQLQDKLQGIFK